MLSNSSLWSSGAGVWLSNGSTAIVRMCDGNAPSENPYRTPHPVDSATSTTPVRLFKNPNDRIKGTGCIDAGHGQLQLPTTEFVAVAHAAPALHPLYYTAIVDPF